MIHNKKIFSSLIFLMSFLLVFPLASCAKGDNNSSSSDSMSESDSNEDSENSGDSETNTDTTESEDDIDSDSTTSSEEPTPITLSTPILSLDNTSGLVSWECVDEAEYYRYYINAGEVQQTTSTFIQLESGSTLSVIAESTLNHVTSSNWSKPVTYYNKEESENIIIAFANTNLESVTIQKGNTYIPNIPSNKKGYEFEGWYLDNFYKEKLQNDYIFNKNTVLFAKYNEVDWVKDATYWLWSSPQITSTTMSKENGWNYIPLYFDNDKSLEKNANIFSAVVNVSGASSTSPATFIGTDGEVGNHPGRIYFKNGEDDFSITSDGTYRIYLSAQYYWTNGENKVNCHIEYLEASSSTNTYNELNIPLGTLSKSSELNHVTISLGEDEQSVKWDVIENANEYQYIIDNGEVKTTTSNSVPLSQGSFITVRAISSLSGYLPSKWSSPYFREAPQGEEYVYVHFYNSNKSSEKILKGSKISRPVNNPVKKYYEFIDYYKDIGCTTLFNFNQEINKNTIIYPLFARISEIKYTLLEENKTTKIADFIWHENYDFNEFKATFNNSNINNKVYVKDNDTNEYYGPYITGYKGDLKIYFSPEHLWDIGTENERNCYIAQNLNTYYFSNNKYWSVVNYYTWYGSGSYEHSWPGSVMTYVKTNSYGEDIYSCSISSSYTHIIFNNNSEQTIDIVLSDYNTNGFYLKSKNSDGKWTVGTWNY